VGDEAADYGSTCETADFMRIISMKEGIPSHNLNSLFLTGEGRIPKDENGRDHLQLA
jgi:hypothetical protein